MPSFVRSCLSCCCSVETEDDDDGMLIDPDDRLRNGAMNGRYGYGSTGGSNEFASGSVGGMSSDVNRKLTPADEEVEILRRILIQTQNNIIDVSAMDQGTSHADFVNRYKKYEETIKKADTLKHKLHKRQGSRCLLADAGTKVLENLSAGPMSEQDYNFVRQLAENVEESVQSGIAIEHKEDLVVHMSPE